MGAELQTEAIKAIYDASLSENRWQGALDRIIDTTEAMSGMLYDFGDLSTVQHSYNTVSTFFIKNREALERYNQMIADGHSSGFDQEGLERCRAFPAFVGIRDEDFFVKDEAFYQRPEVRMTRELYDMEHRVVVKLVDDPAHHLGLMFQYSSAVERPTDADLRMFEMFSPHVAKAIELHRLTQPLRVKYQAVLAVLDMIDLPILLFAGDGTAILKNRAASDLLSGRDALWLDGGGRLVARHSEDTDRIAEAVRRMTATARGDGAHRAIEMEIRNGKAPVYAVISPLRDAEMELEAGLEGAFMTLIDPSYPVRPRTDLVAQAYGLTPAEARVAEFIASGLSNPEIADATGVSPETVKTQVAAVFAKTGSRGRLPFLWRVFQFSPPVL